MNKAVFLDKDGTLIEDVPYNTNPRFIRLMPNSGQGLKVLKENGFKLLIFSNQSGLARGYFTLESLKKVFQTIQVLLAPYGVWIDHFYFCPHHPQGEVKKYALKCNCRKPKTGLLKQAEADFKLDLAKSWVVGDMLQDIEAGNKAGCQSVLLKYGKTEQAKTLAYQAKDLLDAANFITKKG